MEKKLQNFKRNAIEFALAGSFKEKALRKLDESEAEKAVKKAAKIEKKEQNRTLNSLIL